MRKVNYVLAVCGLSLLGGSFCPAASQNPVAMNGGMKIVHSPYNDLIQKVNEDAETVFGSAEGRQAKSADLLDDTGKMIKMLQSMAKMSPMDRAKFSFGDDPLFAQVLQNPSFVKSLSDPNRTTENQSMLESQTRRCRIFRLALDAPDAVQAYLAELIAGGASAANARIERDMADWFDAYQDPTAQLAALDAFKSATESTGVIPPLFLWSELWQMSPPANYDVGKQLCDFLQATFSSSNGAGHVFINLQIYVKRLQLMNQPLTIQGTLTNGAHFTTNDWKGNVILVVGWGDFFPKAVDYAAQVQQMAATHKSQGLKVLWIANAKNFADAKAEVARHPDFPQGELYGQAVENSDFGCTMCGNLLFGTSMTGTPMIIDRAGNVRYIKEQSDLSAAESQVTKWLAAGND